MEDESWAWLYVVACFGQGLTLGALVLPISARRDSMLADVTTRCEELLSTIDTVPRIGSSLLGGCINSDTTEQHLWDRLSVYALLESHILRSCHLLSLISLDRESCTPLPKPSPSSDSSL